MRSIAIALVLITIHWVHPPGSPGRFAADLSSSDPGTWREAQLQLAHVGVEALPHLDTASFSAPPDRIRETLARPIWAAHWR
jgi:hypothetical protein